MLYCSSLVLRDVVRCDANLIFFLFSLVSDFFGKKESVDANVETTAAFDEQPAQSGTVESHPFVEALSSTVIP